jgi:hypothetical protein
MSSPNCSKPKRWFVKLVLIGAVLDQAAAVLARDAQAAAVGQRRSGGKQQQDC